MSSYLQQKLAQSFLFVLLIAFSFASLGYTFELSDPDDLLKPIPADLDFGWMINPAGSSDLLIHHIFVENSMCTLIQGPGGINVLIDGGGNKDGNNIVLPYLRKIGVTDIHFMISTHCSPGYYNGFVHILNSEIKVHTVLVNNADWSDYYYVFRAAVVNRVLDDVYYVTPGYEIDLGKSAFARVIYADGTTLSGKSISVKEEIDRSICLLIGYNDFQYFTGARISDGTGKGGSRPDVEKLIASDVGDVDYFVANDHGSTHASSDYFLSVLRPNKVLVINNYSKYKGNVDSELVTKFNNENIDYYALYQNVDVITVKKKKKYFVNDRAHFCDEKLPNNYELPKIQILEKQHGVEFRKFDITLKKLSKNTIKGVYYGIGDKNNLTKVNKLKFTHQYASKGFYYFHVYVYDRYGFGRFFTKFVHVSPLNLDVIASPSTSNPKSMNTYTLTIKVKTEDGMPIKGARVRAEITYYVWSSAATGYTDANGNCTLKLLTNSYISGFKYMGTVKAFLGDVQRGEGYWWVTVAP